MEEGHIEVLQQTLRDNEGKEPVLSLYVKVNKVTNGPFHRRHDVKYFVKIKVTPLVKDSSNIQEVVDKDAQNSHANVNIKLNVNESGNLKRRTHKFIHWVPDYAVTGCASCERDFRVYRRRHHCRYCGNVFCHYCMVFKLLPLEFGLENEQRVCKNCSITLQPLQEYLRSFLEHKQNGGYLPRLSFAGNYSDDGIKYDAEKFFVYKTRFLEVKAGTEEITWEDDKRIKLSWLSRFFADANGKMKTDTVDAVLQFSLLADGQIIGYCATNLSYLAAKPSRDLMLFDYDSQDCIMKSKQHLPMLLSVSATYVHKAETESFKNDMGFTGNEGEIDIDIERRKQSCSKHVLMATRGTRGDVQPFVALARALAEEYGWRITIVSEMRYFEFIKRHSKVSRGYISFRPSGGDTQKTVDSKLGKWAISLESDYMNILCLSRSEAQFFSSEPSIFYWTKTLKPDCLVFGFTMAAVAMTTSEALGIPLMGFVLQPTCIPSRRFPPILPLDEKLCEAISADPSIKGDDAGRNLEKSGMAPHHFYNHLKEWMEQNPLTQSLNTMRRRRGLVPFSRRQEGKSTLINAIGALGIPTVNQTWRDLTKKNVPLIIPINEMAFGEKPRKWSENTVFTDNIFLRGHTLPELSNDLKAFIDAAKSRGEKVVVLAFSSMPVSFCTIIDIAVKLIEETENRVSIIALIGNHDEKRTMKVDNNFRTMGSFKSYQDTKHQLIDASGRRELLIENIEIGVAENQGIVKIEQKIKRYEMEGRLFVDMGAPFGKLFPLMDAVVTHGGLGSIGEAILSKAPVIVTGVLLFDQRFWGVRCKELGIGPFPVHINKFKRKCVGIINEAVKDNSLWKQNALKIGTKLAELAQDDPSGTKRNAQVVFKMMEKAFPYHYDPPANPVVDAFGAALKYSSRMLSGSRNFDGNENDDDGDLRAVASAQSQGED
uniref:FYVE-type domain-containing protein n=2 Tax=Aplanochytrium stocchinoi TaxID=215587 RepID=A0A7S3PHE7_9STRA|mmetsp:Transcript_8584/g.10119  ORF Transcript_8584/g.10119 Transcript_8584/m.10119 type:complete len:938 (+) Transcript_8584:199-3012(+)|eukprot:CAMPEP_0204830126 /NCGR_PEP_ID=MMETSP1346-20131115/8345_1 /ASSEMBLY_ACC=CAM_ASM_000771 /TAXON_ID=215587 /ORGANISM="Aplanochytrium stocchinoi, Strain GSBS06" /LENGTH=937 /DNA_ID=CAMNT_0051960263 /DNA_START=92 /DNA_END=2905 /DNA_ORIENTATION=-